jgi:hypothetical protein
MIYPNPFSDFTEVSLNASFGKNAEVIIYDLFGNVCMTKEIISDRTRIEKENIRSGVYLMKINDDETYVHSQISYSINPVIQWTR